MNQFLALQLIGFITFFAVVSRARCPRTPESDKLVITPDPSNELVEEYSCEDGYMVTISSRACVEDPDDPPQHLWNDTDPQCIPCTPTQSSGQLVVTTTKDP
eukprot:778068_1